MDARTGQRMLVDEETGMLTESELRTYDALVRAADKAEVKSFVDDRVFRLIKRTESKVRPMY